MCASTHGGKSNSPGLAEFLGNDLNHHESALLSCSV